MSITYVTTQVVNGRDIKEYDAPYQPLSEIVTSKAYVLVLYKNEYILLNIPRLIRNSPNLNVDVTLLSFIATHLTEDMLAGYKVEGYIPRIDYETGRFNHRIEAFDGHAESGMTVAYTSVHAPDIRNDEHKRDTLNDLVLSSTKRSLNNCLVSVNGVFHRTVMFEGELYAREAFHNMKNSNMKHLAVYDTASVGGHKTISLTLDMLRNTDEQDIRQGAYLTLPDDVTLSGKTLMMVIDGYLFAFDGSYQIVGPRTVKVHTNKIDLVNNFLHNPNTRYLHNYKKDLDDPEPGGIVDIQDIITHWIQDIWPFEGVDRDVNKAAYHMFQYLPKYSKSPRVREMIRYYFESVFPHTGRTGDTALVQLDPSGWAGVITDITKLMDYEDFTSEEFVYNRLFSQHSFFIVINNDKIYQRRYVLQPTVEADQFDSRYLDRPRGFLRYNRQKILPYVQYSSKSPQNTLSLGFNHGHNDVYKTILNPTHIPSPVFDVKTSEMKFEAELLEFYSP